MNYVVKIVSNSVKGLKEKIRKLKSSNVRLRKSANLLRIKSICVKKLDAKVEKLKSQNHQLRKAGNEMSYIIGPSFNGENARDRWNTAKGKRIIK
jgi:response regulator RpfG family c-di-GMP phosphodiesterase